MSEIVYISADWMSKVKNSFGGTDGGKCGCRERGERREAEKRNTLLYTKPSEVE